MIRIQSIGSNNPDRDSTSPLLFPANTSSILSTSLRPSESRIIPLMSVVHPFHLPSTTAPVTYPSTHIRTDDLVSNLFHAISFTEENQSSKVLVQNQKNPLSLHPPPKVEREREKKKKRRLTRQRSASINSTREVRPAAITGAGMRCPEDIFEIGP